MCSTFAATQRNDSGSQLLCVLVRLQHYIFKDETSFPLNCASFKSLWLMMQRLSSCPRSKHSARLIICRVSRLFSPTCIMVSCFSLFPFVSEKLQLCRCSPRNFSERAKIISSSLFRFEDVLQHFSFLNSRSLHGAMLGSGNCTTKNADGTADVTEKFCVYICRFPVRNLNFRCQTQFWDSLIRLDSNWHWERPKNLEHLRKLASGKVKVEAAKIVFKDKALETDSTNVVSSRPLRRNKFTEAP